MSEHSAELVASLRTDNSRLWHSLNDLLAVAGSVLAGRPVRNADEVFLAAANTLKATAATQTDGAVATNPRATSSELVVGDGEQFDGRIAKSDGGLADV